MKRSIVLACALLGANVYADVADTSARNVAGGGGHN